MSGGADSQAPAEAMDPVDLLDQEMKEDVAVETTPPSSSCRRGSWTSGSAPAGDTAAWSFVQMNMTLLPIARPLPVNICNRIHDGLVGPKPRTPTQRLHHRVLRNTANISPRGTDESMLRRRGSTSSDSGIAAFAVPRVMITERQYSAPLARCGKRKSDYDMVDTPMPSPTTFFDNEALRSRSHSEDLTTSGDVGVHHEPPVATRSTSSTTLSTFSQRGALFKDKRILEIQHEERRLLPDERVALPSPSKRSRHH